MHPVLEVGRRLRASYHDSKHNNKSNPLDELLFILCSVRTTEKLYQSTFRALKREFPSFNLIADAPIEYIARPLAHGGLSDKKAKAVNTLLVAIVRRFGKPTLSPLRQWSDDECEAFLTSLPGVGKKVARCVMMYSLGRQVFPVDTHCWRICRRLGWVRPTTKDGRPNPKDMDRLQAKIPPELRFSLHVNMVSLGRDICTARNPCCPECPIEAHCKKVGIPRKGMVPVSGKPSSP